MTTLPSEDAVFGGFITSGIDIEAFMYTPLGTGQILLKKANTDVTLTNIELPWATHDLKYVSSAQSIYLKYISFDREFFQACKYPKGIKYYVT